MAVLVVEDLSDRAVGGVPLRWRALAAALASHEPLTTIEVDAVRRDVGCAPSCTCPPVGLLRYGSDLPDPYARHHCPRAGAEIAARIAALPPQPVVVSHLRLHHYLMAAIDAGATQTVIDMHNAEADLYDELLADPFAVRWASLSAGEAAAIRTVEAAVCRAARVVTACSDRDAALINDGYGPATTLVVPNAVEVGPLRDAGPLNATAPLRPTGSLNATGPIRPTGSLNATGPIRPAGSLNATGPIGAAGSLNMSGPIGAAGDSVERARPDLLFLGALRWFPNVQSALWLTQEIFPLVSRLFPAATLTIAGHDAPPVLAEWADGCGAELIADPPDPAALMRGRVLAVPLRFGGGTRLKILEAFAAGCPVISSAKGAEGLDAEPETHYLLADTPRQFAVQLARLCSDPTADRRRRQAAHALVARTYSWNAIERGIGLVLSTAQSVPV